MHSLKMFVRFKSECLFNLVAFEGGVWGAIPSISDEAIPSLVKFI